MLIAPPLQPRRKAKAQAGSGELPLDHRLVDRD
jgi:hypothetical protein